jgi:hypothetical protein
MTSLEESSSLESTLILQQLKVRAEDDIGVDRVDGKKTPMTAIFHGHDVVPGLIYQDANVKVTAIENTHFNFPKGSPPYGKYQSYSCRFETPDRVVVFTGDTRPSALWWLSAA